MIDYDNYKQLHSSRPNDNWLWSYYGDRGYVTMYGVESCSPPFAVARPVHLFSRNFYCAPREGGAGIQYKVLT